MCHKTYTPSTSGESDWSGRGGGVPGSMTLAGSGMVHQGEATAALGAFKSGSQAVIQLLQLQYGGLLLGILQGTQHTLTSHLQSA